MSKHPMDWARVEPLYAELQKETLNGVTAHEWLVRWSDLERMVGEAGSVAARAASENTADHDAERAHLHYIQEIAPRVSVANQSLIVKLLGVPDFEPTPDETHLLRRLRSDADLFREENVPLQTEIETAVTEYDKIAGAMTVEICGERLTLQQAEQDLLDPDRAKREVAWRIVQTRWLQNRPELDALYMTLLESRQRLAAQADRKDYRAFRWQEMQRFDYTPTDALAFGKAIETQVVPLAKERREHRRRQLGLDCLRPWDLEVDPLSRPPLKPFVSPEALEDGGARIFQQIDPELGAYFERLRAEFLDLGSRENKAPGGYCAFFGQSGLPYIFMNAVGTHEDVQTLLHEGGHAFHDMESNASQHLIWNVGAPTEFAEVASMGMELLASPYLEASKGGFYSPDDADRARVEHLEGIIQFLPYMSVVDAFQHWVYAEAGTVPTPTQMDDYWGQLWDRFLPGVDWSGLESERVTGWHRKLHLYQYPFYYIDYGLAQLGALQVWRNAEADQANALRAYRDALALGSTRSLPELFSAAGARFAFDSETVGALMDLIRSHLPE